MSDPEPYTTTEFNALQVDARPNRVRATVEALERAKRERDEARYERDVRREIAIRAESERDALKAALRDLLQAIDGGVESLDPPVAKRRAREALGEVET